MIIELDGPPVSYFESAEGARYTYVSHVAYSETAAELVQALASHLTQLHAQEGHFLVVWRRRPAFELENAITSTDVAGFPPLGTPRPARWRLSYRYVLVPLNPHAPTPPRHKEGCEIQPLPALLGEHLK